MFKITVILPCLIVLAVVGLTLAEVSCDTKCFVSDSVAVLDTRDGIYLVYRVSGFQDKMGFFEVYQGKPEFDSCGITRTPVIAKEPYDRSQGLLQKLELHDNRLEIIYTHNSRRKSSGGARKNCNFSDASESLRAGGEGQEARLTDSLLFNNQTFIQPCGVFLLRKTPQSLFAAAQQERWRGLAAVAGYFGALLAMFFAPVAKGNSLSFKVFLSI